MNSSTPPSSFDDQVEVMSRYSSVPRFQISRNSARYSAGSPKNCPEARGGSVRVQIGLSKPVSFYMVKPRLCPSQDQSSPVQSRRPLGFGQVLSDQPAAYRQRTLWVMINWLLTCFHAGSRYLEVGSWQEAGSNWVTVWLVNSWVLVDWVDSKLSYCLGTIVAC